MKLDLIYCASGNKRFAEIAINSGFLYGSQLPSTVYYQPYFADQNWKKPNRDTYFKAIEKYKPHMGSVLDWEVQEQLQEVLSWAEEIARFVEIVIIIPKVSQGISQLPKTIGGKSVRLGYSVPTKYGGTQLPLSEFDGWDVHLLGGTPQKQMDLVKYMNVKSCDCNYHHRMAMFTRFWDNTNLPSSQRYWPTLIEADGIRWEKDAIYEAFRRSCENIQSAWKELK